MTNLSQERAERDGTFKFCLRCPSANNCCVRFRHRLGEVESPPLLRGEQEVISAHTGLNVDVFADTSAVSVLVVKRADNCCYFYKNGRCTIYSARPFDCKIFPFDIIKYRDQFCWIVYLDLCPPEVDFSLKDEDFEAAKQYLREANVTLADLTAFVRYGRDVMAPHRYKLLEPVTLNAE